MKTLILCLLLIPFTALAQNKCTMPDGSIVKTNWDCPSAALKTEGPDGKITHHKPIEVKPPRPAPLVAAPAIPANKPPEGNVFEDAQVICVMLRAIGATTCDVNINVFSASYIDATVATTARDAQGVCKKMAEFTHKPDSTFMGRGWQLKLFSPLGSGTRPIAQCAL